MYYSKSAWLGSAQSHKLQQMTMIGLTKALLHRRDLYSIYLHSNKHDLFVRKPSLVLKILFDYCSSGFPTIEGSE